MEVCLKNASFGSQEKASAKKVSTRFFVTKNLLFGITLLIQVCYFIAPVYAGVTKEILVDASSRSLIAPEAKVYQWYYNNTRVEGETSQTLKVAKSGFYTVELLDSKGNMTSQSAAIMVTRATIKKIYLIGDSTVANYTTGYYPQTGWGQVLGLFFNSANVVVDNRAVGGTSSKSFYDKYWTGIKNSLAAGDYVFIQFGINDAAKTDPARYTIPGTTFKEYLTKYVNEARAKGAIPVLVATLRRNSWNGTSVYDAYHGYPVATRELAKSSLNVPLIDLDQMCKTLMESLGSEYTTNFMYMNLAAGEYPNFSSGRADNVHFQEMGAIEMAKLVVKGIRDLSSDSRVSSLISSLVPTYKITTSQSNNSAGLFTRTEYYPKGIKVTLKTRPKSGFTFQKWVNSANTTMSTNRMFSFTMGTSSQSYKAVYSGSTRIMDSPEANEQEVGSSTSLYPNPSNGAFHIVSKGAFNYTIKDSFGKLKESGNGIEECIAGSDLTPGMYFLRIQSNKEDKQIKIIKQ